MESSRIIADDLGLAVPVNDGILFLLKEKKIDGVSVLPTGAAFADAVQKIKDIQEGQIGAGSASNFMCGVHLTLVEEASVLLPKDIKSLIGLGGRFHRNHRIFFLRYILGMIKLEEVEQELRAQIQKCLKTDLKISFLNSHQHLHLLPGIMTVVIRLAREFGISYIRIVREPVSGRPGGLVRKLQAHFLSYLSALAIPRLKTAGIDHNDVFIGFLHAGSISSEDIRQAGKCKDRVVEINCHPGYEDADLRRRYADWGSYHWQDELNVIKDLPS